MNEGYWTDVMLQKFLSWTDLKVADQTLSQIWYMVWHATHECSFSTKQPIQAKQLFCITVQVKVISHHTTNTYFTSDQF